MDGPRFLPDFVAFVFFREGEVPPEPRARRVCVLWEGEVPSEPRAMLCASVVVLEPRMNMDGQGCY